MRHIFRYIFIPAIALLITVKIFAWFKEFMPNVPQQTEQSKGEVLIGGAFQLVNQDGKTVTDKDFAGKYMLVYFGFTSCPMICPTDMSDITVALNSLDKEQLEKIQPIFISVDPKRDTAEKMKSFIASFHPKFIGLTGTKEQVDAAEKVYRVYAKEVKEEGKEDYTMDHSAYTYLMGTDGKYLAHFGHEQTPEEIAVGLKTYLK
jgi:protein SCO1/2